MTATHDRDFYPWNRKQAAHLLASRWQDIHRGHLAEALDLMGARERRELTHRLAELLADRLKWLHQPERRGNSGCLTTEVQRLDLVECLDVNPSLRPRLGDHARAAYLKAILLAA